MASPNDLLSVGEAALLLGVSADTIRRYGRDERLPEYRTPTKQRRYRRADVEALLTVTPAADEHTQAAS